MFSSCIYLKANSYGARYLGMFCVLPVMLCFFCYIRIIIKRRTAVNDVLASRNICRRACPSLYTSLGQFLVVTSSVMPVIVSLVLRRYEIDGEFLHAVVNQRFMTFSVSMASPISLLLFDGFMRRQMLRDFRLVGELLFAAALSVHSVFQNLYSRIVSLRGRVPWEDPVVMLDYNTSSPKKKSEQLQFSVGECSHGVLPWLKRSVAGQEWGGK